MSALRATARCYTSRVGAPALARLQRRAAAGTRAYAAAETSESSWTKSTLPGPPPPPTEAAPAAEAAATTAAAAAAADKATSAWSKRVFQDAVKALAPRTSWTREEISAVYHQPLMELVQQASTVHRRFHNPAEVQLCTLMNIKTGGCTEDCKYCAQSTRYQAGTGLAAQKAEPVAAVLAAARAARDAGSTRFCMGAAWRDMRGRKNGLRNVVEMVTGVRALGLEACVTLGMVDAEQARTLKAAGLTAYNHNVDTSREFYPSVISTRTYDERLATLANVRDAGIHVCSGGIVGLGEEARDRIGLLHTVSTLPQHPESFPVNALVPIPGTPLGDTPPLPFGEVLRTVATARILMPATIVRLAAGRKAMAEERQALCFLAGANAVFTGEKMLTTECNGYEEDRDLFARWGLLPMKSFHKRAAPAEVEE